jgi:hypothetical protein
MSQISSRGHLYSAESRQAVRVSIVIALFALAYALVTLAIGVIPLNMLLRKLMGSALMPAIWRNSALQLAERTALATLACWLALAISGRIRGRLTGRGMIAVGAAMSGALAGAIDVGAHKLWVSQLIQAAHTAPWRGQVLSAAMTVAVSLLVTLLLITRSTKVLSTDS